MKSLHIIFIIILCSVGKLAHGAVNQDTTKNTGWYGLLQLGYIHHSSVNYYDIGELYEYESSGSHERSLNILVGYFVMPKRLALGVGFGLDGFHKPYYNTAPLYADARYFFSEKRNSFYARASYGGRVRLITPLDPTGAYVRLGGGYKVFISRKMAVNLDVSYAPTRLNFAGRDEYWKMQGVAFSLGFFLF
jgi:hypothetical protein